jgi:hypothetical protein
MMLCFANALRSLSFAASVLARQKKQDQIASDGERELREKESEKSK